jgi:hypothetical protein
MQHDLYHVYTVDQHILMVLRNLRRFTMPEFAHEFPLCSQLMSGLERHWLLYVAALFHDIAKGRGGDHSTLGKVDARRFCRRHGFSKDDADLVVFLVEHHLTMSAVAQKQDVDDPEPALCRQPMTSATWPTRSWSPISAAPARKSGTAGRRSCWRPVPLGAASVPALDTDVAGRPRPPARCACMRCRRGEERFWASLDTTACATTRRSAGRRTCTTGGQQGARGARAWRRRRRPAGHDLHATARLVARIWCYSSAPV